MRTPELEARHRASAIVARMYLRTLQAMMGDFARENISMTLPDMLIAMVVRLNDDLRKTPISISEIERMTGISRKTVRRHVRQLVERGVVIREDDGVVGSDAYLSARIDAAYFKEIVAAIRDAAKELEGYQ
jgi:DNA-binding Lrp family transcriptional regulator